MFKHIITPVSDDAITKSELKQVIKLAMLDKAKITLVYVSDPIGPYMYADSTASIVISEKEHQDACNKFAKKLFTKAKAQIPEEITVDTVHIFHPNIADGIIDAAKSMGADVICMASHKRTGISGFFLRSESHEVILHSQLPVLILNS